MLDNLLCVSTVVVRWEPAWWASLVAQLVKNLPAMQETLVQFLSWEDPLKKRQGYPLQYSWASLVAQLVKNPPAMQETWVRSLGRDDPMKEGMTTHFSIPAWRIPTDRELWGATVHRVKKQTPQSNQAHTASLVNAPQHHVSLSDLRPHILGWNRPKAVSGL